MINKMVAKFIATTFYTGLFPIAPGTVGTFVALIILWFLPSMEPMNFLGMTVIYYFLGVSVSTTMEEDWGKDPGRINWDEVVGTMVTLLFLPKTLLVYVLAFILFRIFDIVKPFPVNRAEDLPSGWGVMTDDVIAGIYANIVLRIILVFIPG